MAVRSWLAGLLYRFSGRLPCRIIDGDNGEPYLERYFLLKLPFGGGVYIHRFVASDPDRGLHDHPWRWALGLILAGGYEELRYRARGSQPVSRRRRDAGRFNFIRGGDFHRILLPPQSEVWTLFLHTGKRKSWGFLEIFPDGRTDYRPHDARIPDGAHRNWWETAPLGRELRRLRWGSAE